MAKIEIAHKDVIWNYIGTLVSMVSNFALLPLLMVYLSSEELGLWYVLVAIANLAALFEFGFTPTFSRNIVYVISGMSDLPGNCVGQSKYEHRTNWHLLNAVITASRIVYAFIAGVVLIVLATAGSAYIFHVSGSLSVAKVSEAWVIFCAAIVLNIYFLYTTTLLRGYGDVASENKAKTFARLLQILFSGVLLLLDFGIVGAAIGYLINTLAMRLLSARYVNRHEDINEGRRSDKAPIRRDEIVAALRPITAFSWRDGLVQVSTYASTQAMSILSSLFLSLSETGVYSILLQFATASGTLAAAYSNSYFPLVQRYYAEKDEVRIQHLAARGVVLYWILYIAAQIIIIMLVLPLLKLIKTDIHVKICLYLLMAVYIALLQHHSIFCNYIVCTNEIPYVFGYMSAAALGIVSVCCLCNSIMPGAYGIITGQLMSQLVYNNWRWPQYFCKKVGIQYSSLLKLGILDWADRFRGLADKLPHNSR